MKLQRRRRAVKRIKMHIYVCVCVCACMALSCQHQKWHATMRHATRCMTCTSKQRANVDEEHLEGETMSGKHTHTYLRVVKATYSLYFIFLFFIWHASSKHFHIPSTTILTVVAATAPWRRLNNILRCHQQRTCPQGPRSGHVAALAEQTTLFPQTDLLAISTATPPTRSTQPRATVLQVIAACQC